MCISCGKDNSIGRSKTNKYCNNKCQQDFQYKIRLEEWEKTGNINSVLTVKRYLKEVFGNKCSRCGIDNWNDEELIFELEHKDGNSDNNSKKNVCLLCPNCHSQTPTYKSKNKGNGRYYRRKRYDEGKSF